MSLYMDGKVDPIAAAGGRELDFIPKHFHCVPISYSFYHTRELRNWVWKNQVGRFALVPRSKLEEKYITTEYVIAFEDPGEAIMFSFVQPTLHNADDDFFI